MDTLNEKMSNTKPLTMENHISSLFLTDTFDDSRRTSALDKANDFCKKKFGLIDFNIYIIKSNKSQIPVFMGIMTSKQKRDIAASIISQFKNKTANPSYMIGKSLNIAIDHRLFMSMNQWGITFTAKEIVAGIIHEIGHVLHIDEIIKTISDKMAFDNTVDARKIKNEQIINIIDTYMMNMDKDDIELNADLLAVKYGYGQELVSLLRKFKTIYEKAGGSSIGKQQQLLMRKRYDNVLNVLMEELSDSENDDSTKTYIRKQMSKIRSLGY